MRLFTHKAGATFDREIHISLDGDPFDLTGATARAAVRTCQGHFVGNLAVGLTESVNGILRISASADLTAEWTAGPAFYDVRIQMPDGRVIASPSYQFDIEKGATRG